MQEYTVEHLMSAKETAEYLKISYKTLAVWRCTGKYDLKYVKVGGRVYYRRDDVNSFITTNTINPKRKKEIKEISKSQESKETQVEDIKSSEGMTVEGIRNHLEGCCNPDNLFSKRMGFK